MEPAPDSTSEARSTTTSLKRKADEAFDALDDALRPTTDSPSPPKRTNSSIYGSLAKYGLFNKPSLPRFKSTSTPTLTALLSRARSRPNVKASPISQYTTTSSATPEYSPGSTDAFLKRLSTFSFSTYPSKPQQIDAVAASKAGWINEGGKDRLYCAICRAGWVVAGRDGLSKEAGDALIEKQRQSLVDMHKEGCPWRVRQCDPLVYRIPLQSPTKLAKQIKAFAAELEPLLDGIAIRHPLSSNQVQNFVHTVSSVSSHNSSFPSSSPPSTDNTTQSHTPSLSPASLLTSLFGWSLVPPPQPLSRKSSSASLALARTHSRASFVQNRADPSRTGTPTPGGSNIPTFQSTPGKGPITPFTTPLNGKGISIESSTVAPSPFPAAPSREPPQQKDAMLQCQMCQRRIGLWAFATPTSSRNNNPADPQRILPPNSNSRPQRQLDLLREHRSYCPYVVKSTPLAALPSYPPPPQSSTPRSSFNLIRTGTSSSVSETQSSTSGFNMQRTASLLAGASSLARTNSLSFPIKPGSSESQDHNLVEGWRAVYNTVLRYGMSERSRVIAPLSGSPVSPQGTQPVVEHEKVEDDAMAGVVELVEGVKRHGGKQLLSYVRNLLG